MTTNVICRPDYFGSQRYGSAINVCLMNNDPNQENNGSITIVGVTLTVWLSLVTCSYILLTENDDVGNFPVHTMHEITSETPLTSIRPHVGWEQCSPTAHKLYPLRHTTKEINWKWNTSNCKKPSATAHYQMSWSQRPWTSCPAQCCCAMTVVFDLLHCLQSTYCTIFSK